MKRAVIEAAPVLQAGGRLEFAGSQHSPGQPVRFCALCTLSAAAPRPPLRRRLSGKGGLLREEGRLDVDSCDDRSSRRRLSRDRFFAQPRSAMPLALVAASEPAGVSPNLKFVAAFDAAPLAEKRHPLTQSLSS